MEGFIIHLHLYLTSRETELTAYNNLKSLKNAGFKILITSPKPLPLDFYQYVDHYYYDPENQLMELEYDKPEPVVWWHHHGNIAMNFVVDGFQKHGLIVLRSMIKGAQIASCLGYKNIIRFEFDDVFGFNSLKKIKDICNEIENKKYDFYAYKNDYNNNRIDVSTHLIFYSVQSFKNVFEHIKNEFDYKNALKEIGFENKPLILEEFIYRLIDRSDLNILYQNGQIMNEIFSDTRFNMHQSEIGVYEGVLSDVMKVVHGTQNDCSSLCLVAQNISSDIPVSIYFDLYNNENKLINTIELCVQIKGQWMYDYLNDTKNIKKIKIRHQNNHHHKTFDIYFKNDCINIQNIDISNYNYQPEIVFK